MKPQTGFKVVTEREIQDTLKKRVPANTSSNIAVAINTCTKREEF